MPYLKLQLDLARCPYCKVDSPTLHSHANFGTHALAPNALAGDLPRYWRAYACSRCGGVVIASAASDQGEVTEFHPQLESVDTAIPEPARSYLQQAVETLFAPSGSVMLSASAVDAMLKAKSYTEGSLFARIDKAAADHLITQEMAKWAHEVRLDANAQRHGDEAAPLPSYDDAKRAVDFVRALAEFLFVLPSKVRRGLADTAESGGAA